MKSAARQRTKQPSVVRPPAAVLSFRNFLSSSFSKFKESTRLVRQFARIWNSKDYRCQYIAVEEAAFTTCSVKCFACILIIIILSSNEHV